MKVGYSKIDKHIRFRSNDLIAIGGRPAMGKTSFALNIIARNTDCKGCLISLVENDKSLQHKQGIINGTYILEKELSLRGIELKNGEISNIEYLELPKLIELIELIVRIKDKYDFFIIDDFGYVEMGIKPLFNDDKNYQIILRHLKALCLTLNKNIVLLTNIDRKVEEVKYVFAFSYYGVREKYLDCILVLHRPEYYGITENEFGEKFKKGDTKVYLSKYSGNPNEKEFDLKFNSDNFTFS